jgi:hypothetical protein
MKNPFIRTIYLYLFALVGLALVAIGAVRLVNVGLKIFVFTKADQEINFSRQPPIFAPQPLREVKEEDFLAAMENCKQKCILTETQKDEITRWLADYKIWREHPKIDYQSQQRQRESAWSLAFILVGLPLWLYHWAIIKRERSLLNQDA